MGNQPKEMSLTQGGERESMPGKQKDRGCPVPSTGSNSIIVMNKFYFCKTNGQYPIETHEAAFSPTWFQTLMQYLSHCPCLVLYTFFI